MLHTTTNIHRGVKLFFDEDRKVLFIDEIPHTFYNKNIDYPIWIESVVSAPGFLRKEAYVPHYHILPNGDIVEMKNVKFPLYCIPHVKSIKFVKYEEKGEKFYWLAVDSKIGYSHMIVSNNGIRDNAENLQYITQLPEYLKSIKIY